MIYRNLEHLLCTLYEKYHNKNSRNQSFDAYKLLVAKKLKENGATFISASAKPFAFKFKYNNDVYKLKVNSKMYDCVQMVK